MTKRAKVRKMSCCISNLRESRMQQHGRKYFACRPPPPPPTKRSNFHFSEHGHVAYQIKGNHECSNKLAYILSFPQSPTPTLGMGSIGQKSTFSGHGHVVYQIKGNYEGGNKQACILSFRTPSTPWVGSKVKNIFF